MKCVFHILMLSLFSMALTAQVDDGPDEKAAILERVQQMYADLSDCDWPAFRQHFWPDARLVAVWQKPPASEKQVIFTSLDTFIAEAPNGPESKPIFEERMEKASVNIFQNLAQVWSSFQAKFGEPGQIMEWSGIDAITLLKHNGEWRIVNLSYAAEF